MALLDVVCFYTHAGWSFALVCFCGPAVLVAKLVFSQQYSPLLNLKMHIKTVSSYSRKCDYSM